MGQTNSWGGSEMLSFPPPPKKKKKKLAMPSGQHQVR